MASYNLYAPRINTISPAFVVKDELNDFCELYFNMSVISGNVVDVVKGIHISVTKQDTGISVVNKNKTSYEETNGWVSFRESGTIIKDIVNIEKNDENNLYFVKVYGYEIDGGWKPGWIYKFQIRVSDIAYLNTHGTELDNIWMTNNANHFSEWSTYCTSKAIKQPEINILELRYNNEPDSDMTFPFSTLELNGSYSNEDSTELLYSYNITLLKDNAEIEKSKTLYSNQYYNPNQLNYEFKYEFTDGNYKLILKYITINKYEETREIEFEIKQDAAALSDIYIGVAETSVNTTNTSLQSTFTATSARIEEEEGRIGLKIYSDFATDYSRSLVIRRTDSFSNFTKWEDIRIILPSSKLIADFDIIYDYTVQSGVWYKYGIQEGDLNPATNSVTNRTKLNVIEFPIIREFDSAFLLGEDNRQLKLNLSNNVSSYGYTVSESKQDTIGGKYPIITKNGNMNYRTFPISGFISFNMDDRDTFLTDEELYQYKEVAKLYKDLKHGQYDYNKEYFFREKVLAWLQDGKPKLFKSATEGNIIVRLMNISTSPNQTLSRMIGTFNAQATEIAEATSDNYIKYKLTEEV